MAFDFPATPTVGQAYSLNGISYVWNGYAWVQSVQPILTPARLDLRRNRIVNPSMQISQENADATMGPNIGATYYPADQWTAAWSFTGTAAMMLAMRVRPAASGSDNIMMRCVAGAPSLATGNYIQLFQTLEGESIKDLLWGTAQAKPVVLRFLFYTSLAGTYTAVIRNGATDRSFLKKFTAPALSWTEVIIPVPGDITGTWPTTNAAAMLVGVGISAGPNFVGVEGWQAGHKIVAPGTTHGAVADQAFYMTDVGFYLDDGSAMPPRFEIPNIADELLRCQRYYQRHHSVLIPSGYTAAGTLFYSTLIIPAMRTTPTVTVSGASYSNASAAALNVAAPTVCRMQAVMTAAGAGWADVIVSLSARI